MNNKTKGAIAGIAGIALLAGGTTFALWNDDTTNANGGIITAGNLEVATVGTTQWVDTSADRARMQATGSTSAAPTRSFRATPAKGAFLLGIAAALEGGQLVANLGLSLAGNAEGGLLADTKGVTVKYSWSTRQPALHCPGAGDIALESPRWLRGRADNFRKS